jgi:inner membrane protein
MAWWLWIVLAAALALAELHAPGTYLIWIALGAGLTAAVEAIIGLSISAQVASFAGASALACIVGYFIYRRSDQRQHAGAPLNRRDLSIVGSHGVTLANFANGEGKVRLGDTVWLAEGPNLAADTHVVVKSLRGARVVVEASDRNAPDK